MELTVPAKDMQVHLKALQKSLRSVPVQGVAGEGAVSVTMTCGGDLIGIELDQAMLAPENKEALERLIMQALNAASAQKDETIKRETRNMMKGIGLSGIPA